MVPVLLLSLFCERRRKKEGRGELKQREEEEERERERRIQLQRLGGRQLFSEAAEKRKCLPSFLLGQRGWIGGGLGGGKRRRRGGGGKCG